MHPKQTQTNEGAITQVSDTALWVAYYRALESKRPDALFHDPYAEKLAGEKGRKISENMGESSKYVAWSVSVRTWVIDRLLEKLIGEGVTTVLNLGAGLDTRPLRMDLPTTLRWIEVDYPHLLNYKNSLLGAVKPKCQLERVAVDLANGNARREFFSRVATDGQTTLVLTEGVIPYLSEAHVSDLAKDLSAHPNFKFWIGEYFSPESYRILQSKKRAEKMRQAPFQFFPKDWFGVFRAEGWVPREIESIVETSWKLKRTMPIPWWARLLLPILSQGVTEKAKKMTAYVVFVREALT